MLHKNKLFLMLHYILWKDNPQKSDNNKKHPNYHTQHHILFQHTVRIFPFISIESLFENPPNLLNKKGIKWKTRHFFAVGVAIPVYNFISGYMIATSLIVYKMSIHCTNNTRYVYTYLYRGKKTQMTAQFSVVSCNSSSRVDIVKTQQFRKKVFLSI